MTEPQISFGRLIGTSIITKFQISTVRQLFSPFLPIIAAGLGIDVVVLGQMLGVRDLTSLLTPVIGASADRIGYRTTLRFCLLLTAFGSLIIGSSTNLWLFTLGIIITGIGSAAFSPVLHAYCSIFLPYAKRARGLGMVEYSWALTSIVGLSTAGVIIEWYGWRTPFLLLGTTLLFMWFLLGALPTRSSLTEDATADSSRTPTVSRWQMLRSFFQVETNRRSTYSTILIRGFISFAAMQWIMTYGLWFSTQYALTAAQLGGLALILGCFDLVGSVCVSLFTDRLGKRKSVILGTTVALIGSLAIPWLDIAIMPALIGLAVTRTGFEFGIVSTLPLLSQQVSGQPGKILSLGSSASWLGGGLASIMGPWLYVNYGIGGNSMAAFVGFGMALALLLLWVNEGE